MTYGEFKTWCSILGSTPSAALAEMGLRIEEIEGLDEIDSIRADEIQLPPAVELACAALDLGYIIGGTGVPEGLEETFGLSKTLTGATMINRARFQRLIGSIMISWAYCDNQFKEIMKYIISTSVENNLIIYQEIRSFQGRAKLVNALAAANLPKDLAKQVSDLSGKLAKAEEVRNKYAHAEYIIDHNHNYTGIRSFSRRQSNFKSISLSEVYAEINATMKDMHGIHYMQIDLLKKITKHYGMEISFNLVLIEGETG